ncbi:MAG TPA: ABC transporter ATP-binding protein, partial [Terriglobia bacterium]|nr:ABC transporter ATP-binding protein [Terriglobia bacterium]
SQHHEEEALDKSYDARLMRRLIQYLKPYQLQVLAAMLLIGVASLMQVSSPYLTKIGIDNYIIHKDQAGLNRIVLIYLGIVAFGFFLGYIQTYIMQLTGQKIMVDLRLQIFSHLQNLPLAFFDKNPVGRLMTRVTTDVDVLNELFTAGVVTLLGDVLVLLGIVAILFYLNAKLALVAFSVIPLIFLITVIFKIKARDSYRRVRTAIARINAFLQEHIAGMSIVQLFSHEQRSFQRFDQINQVHLKANLDSVMAYSLFFPAVEVVSALAVALIIWYGGGQVLQSELSFGALVAFIQYSERFFRPIADLSEKYNILQSAMASSERIFKLLDTPVDIQQPKEPVRLGEIKGHIEFRNVWFAYNSVAAKDGRASEWDWVLKDVSFKVSPGESVAIVGHTGAGKTTLTSLLMRFYDTQKGQILLDGHDIRKLDLRQLRSAFGFVLQDVFLFSGSIASNIRLGTPWITEEAIHRAAQDVNLDEFVQDLTNGYAEEVKERGSTLSTGQKQLIAFARALAHDPKNLILDEATSSVDTETELRIRDAIARLMKGRTSIIIAHRLSTIQRADKILVMHKGQVREMGTHQELLAQRGIYYKLYQLQYKEQDSLVMSDERLMSGE